MPVVIDAVFWTVPSVRDSIVVVARTIIAVVVAVAVAVVSVGRLSCVFVAFVSAGPDRPRGGLRAGNHRIPAVSTEAVDKSLVGCRGGRCCGRRCYSWCCSWYCCGFG